MPVKTRSEGPRNAAVMIVGEAPGAEEEIKGTPFVGGSGQELTKMLHEAGILRTECFITNVCKYRPPGNEIDSFFLDKKLSQPNELVKEGLEELYADVAAIKPKMIIALGNTALWAFKGHRLISKWRGSMLEHGTARLLPTLHPANIMRDWAQRAIAVHDLKRAMKYVNSPWPKPEYNFYIRPSFKEVIDILQMLIDKATTGPLRIASDLETRSTHIACHCIAWSRLDAISIPSMCVERPHGYWTLAEDVAIWQKERELMTHPNIEVIGQNYLYDA